LYGETIDDGGRVLRAGYAESVICDSAVDGKTVGSAVPHDGYGFSEGGKLAVAVTDSGNASIAATINIFVLIFGPPAEARIEAIINDKLIHYGVLSR